MLSELLLVGLTLAVVGAFGEGRWLTIVGMALFVSASMALLSFPKRHDGPRRSGRADLHSIGAPRRLPPQLSVRERQGAADGERGEFRCSVGDRSERPGPAGYYVRKDVMADDSSGRSRPDSNGGCPTTMIPTALGGAAPARSALTLRAVFAAFGLLFCAGGAWLAFGAGLTVVGWVLVVVAIVALVDLGVVLMRKRRGEPV